MSDLNRNGLLSDSRVYLSGPMDFVASRTEEKEHGWRRRVSEFLHQLGVIVFDPWEKPEVRGMHEYGKEGEGTANVRAGWTYEPGERGAQARAQVTESFWPALHIDLRMVDTSDFIVCYCPTNIYSVGTPHEIIQARQQHKPVLFVSPYVTFDALARLTNHLNSRNDQEGLAKLNELIAQVPIKENLNASPSLWYMPLVGMEHFFDGFGFAQYQDEFKWPNTPLDDHERDHPPRKPLLPFIASANRELPKKWDHSLKKMVPNDDWLLWDLRRTDGGAQVHDVKR